MKNKLQPGRIELLIDISEKLFAEKGYGETSVRDIAREAGVNIAMISYYFGSKRQLLQAIIKNRSRQLWQQFKTRDEPEQNASCESIIHHMVASVFSHPQFFMLLIQLQSIASMAAELKYFNRIQRKYFDYISNHLHFPETLEKKMKSPITAILPNIVAILLSTLIEDKYSSEGDKANCNVISKQEVASWIVGYLRSTLTIK